jgi:hypothetical protein
MKYVVTYELELLNKVIITVWTIGFRIFSSSSLPDGLEVHLAFPPTGVWKTLHGQEDEAGHLPTASADVELYVHSVYMYAYVHGLSQDNSYIDNICTFINLRQEHAVAQ